MNKYVKEFYNLRCNPEILDAVLPVQNLKKEISESLAIIKKIRKIVLSNKDKNFIIYDFCAGNALTSVICSFLFRNVFCIAIDKRDRDRKWEKVGNFQYIKGDILRDNWIHNIHLAKKYDKNTRIIVLGVHACKNLSERIVEIYNKSESDYLILMPCCTGDTTNFSLPNVVSSKIGRYIEWCFYLHTKIKTSSKMYIDNYCMSPKNCILLSKK